MMHSKGLRHVVLLLVIVGAVGIACTEEPTPTPTPPTLVATPTPPTLVATPTPPTLVATPTPPTLVATPMPVQKATPTPTPEPLREVVTLTSELPIRLDSGNAIERFSNEAISQIYGGLTEDALGPRADGALVGTGELIPGLAESWEISGGNTVYTFKLRDNLISEFGNRMTAAMYKERMDMGRERGIVSQFIFDIAGLSDPDSIQVVDELTIRMTTKEPNTTTLGLMSTPWVSPIDMVEVKRHATETDKWGAEWMVENAAGFGAYRVTRWIPNSEFVMEFNPNYYGEPPEVQRAVMRQVPSGAVRLALLLTGRADIARDLSGSQLEKAQTTEGFGVTSFVGSDFLALIMKTTEPPYDNLKVRQAISYAIPYTDIVNTVYQGFAEEPRSYLTSAYPSYTDKFWPYQTDLDKAGQLLAEAGYAGGFETTVAIHSANPAIEGAALLLKSNLKEIGVDLTIDKMTLANFNAKQFAGEMPGLHVYQSFPILLTFDYAATFGFTSTSFYNFGKYENARVDELVAEGYRTFDPEKRVPLAEELQDIIVDNASWAGLRCPVFITLTGRACSGYPGGRASIYSSNT